MKELIRQFEEKKPEIIFEWKDAESEAEGWIVINSLRNGAAGGGTRMRKGLDKREVESLAKTMEVKFTVSGPAIGGAKSGINFDPQDPRKKQVLERWYKAVIPLLKNYYGTGGDLNVDEIHEVIPITEEFGLWHPQEGVVNGFYRATEPQKINKIGQLRYGVSKVLEDEKFSPSLAKKYTVADMITGYGVAESVRHYYELWSKNYVGKKAIIQGWGNVASAAAYYLSNMGVKIVGIIDRAGGIIDSNGLSKEKINELFLKKEKNALVDKQLLSFEEANQRIWETQAEIFIPAAASRIVTKAQVEKLIQNKLEVISCGANVPFQDAEIFYGPTAEFADQHVAVIPDFVANCGMARVFAYLMQDEVEMTDQAIFTDVSVTIKKALEKVKQKTKTSNGIYQLALELALKELLK